jgi:hypothetical protein
MKIQDLIVETKKVKWQDLKDLQPENLKLPYHAEKTKKSIMELGFAQAIYVWQEPETQNIWICDGHARKEILIELVNDGFDVPEELNCTFLDNTKIKTKEEAIKYLLRVFNIKRNPMDSEVVENWLEEMDLSVEDVCFDDLDIKFETQDFESEPSDLSDKNKEVEEISGVFDDHLSGTKGFHKLTLLFNEDQYSLVSEVLKNEKVQNITEWFYNIVNEKYYN